MSVRRDIIDSFRGFSMAMCSTWLWHRPSRSMFDAGEGISPHMRNHVLAIENVFLTHGHHDHLGGVAGLALARGAARGDKDKPFVIFHPGGWGEIEALKRYIDAVCDNSRVIAWKEIVPGDSVTMSDDGKTSVRAFEVRHASRLCLGYAMVEKRVRLRKEFSGLPGKEIAAIAAERGRDAINEPYEKIVFAYSGDCSGVDPDSVPGADVLFHEGTFVEKGELVGDGEETAMRAGGGHSTVRGAVGVAAKAGVGVLVLVHLSMRYSVESAVAEARATAGEFGFAGGISLLHGSRMIEVGAAS